MDLYPLAWPLLRCLAPEAAHRATLAGLRAGLAGRASAADGPELACSVFGLDFANPVGLAPGFDKNAVAMGALAALGFGFVEVGGVTPRPQPGNARPRVFRLVEDEAVINRLGFNNKGLDRAARRIAAAGPLPCPLGANLGINKDATDPAADFVAGIERLGPLVGYATVNVSSPNTPGLRDLQDRAALDALLGRVMEARDRLPERPRPLAVLVKIAPDLDEAALTGIVETALARNVDGLVVSNTTTARPETLRSRHRTEAGGLSGRPLFEASTRMVATVYRMTDGAMPLIGVGGIASGADAYAKIRAGASLVQLYTALIYRGPVLIGRIKADLARRLGADGIARIADAVGRDAAG